MGQKLKKKKWRNVNFGCTSEAIKPFKNTKYFLQELNFDRLTCMPAICYSDPILAIPTKKQLLSEKRMCAQFKIDISKTKGLVRIYTNSGQCGGYG